MPRATIRVPAKRRQGTPKTPADSTKILNGIGGGSRAGITRASRSQRSKAARVRATWALPNLRSRSGSPPRRPISHSRLQPASEPRVAIVIGTQAVCGRRDDEVTTRMSLISGRLRKDESQKATRKRPDGPSAGSRTNWIQRTSLCIEGPGVSGGPEEELFGLGVEVEDLSVAGPVERRRELPLGLRLREALLQPLQEAGAGRAAARRALHRAPDVGDEGELAQAAPHALLPLRLLG